MTAAASKNKLLRWYAAEMSFSAEDVMAARRRVKRSYWREGALIPTEMKMVIAATLSSDLPDKSCYGIEAITTVDRDSTTKQLKKKGLVIDYEVACLTENERRWVADASSYDAAKKAAEDDAAERFPLLALASLARENPEPKSPRPIPDSYLPWVMFIRHDNYDSMDVRFRTGSARAASRMCACKFVLPGAVEYQIVKSAYTRPGSTFLYYWETNFRALPQGLWNSFEPITSNTPHVPLALIEVVEQHFETRFPRQAAMLRLAALT